MRTVTALKIAPKPDSIRPVQPPQSATYSEAEARSWRSNPTRWGSEMGGGTRRDVENRHAPGQSPSRSTSLDPPQRRHQGTAWEHLCPGDRQPGQASGSLAYKGTATARRREQQRRAAVVNDQTAIANGPASKRVETRSRYRKKR